MRKINNRQKLIHRDPIARLLPGFKQRIIRPRTRYIRKGRRARWAKSSKSAVTRGARQ